MIALRAWFDKLLPREQRIVLVGAVLTTCLLLFVALLPLEKKVSAVQQRVTTKQSDLAWMRSMAPRLATLRSTTLHSGNESLVVLADRVARETGIARSLSGSQPGGNGTLSVRLEQVAFDSLTAWAAALLQQHGVHVISASIDHTATAGVVSATITLRAAP
jgi:general secretion pathway protein M